MCIASGPSLTPEDVEYCRGKARVIVVNRTLLLAPWADAFHACDRRVWTWLAAEIGAFAGLKFSIERTLGDDTGAILLKNGGDRGLSTDPGVICTGRNSGFQAINIVTLLGVSRVVLLGYDMQRGPSGEKHWHGEHPNKSEPPYVSCREAFASLVQPLADLGVSVVNCTRRTALTCFPCQPLEETL